jgi:predicted lysophospholipase L1 biosynthesis ABC-type transport system permease subunit
MRSRRIGIALVALVATLTPSSDTQAQTAGGAPPPEILISRQLARRAGLEPGDVVRLGLRPSEAEATPFRVAGLYEPRPDPFRLGDERLELRMHLPDLKRLAVPAPDPFWGESVTWMGIALRDPRDAAAFSRELAAKLPGLVALPTVEPSRLLLQRVLDRFQRGLSIVALACGTWFLIAMMVLRAEERRIELGILRVLGVSGPRAVLALFGEAALVASAGAALGVLLGIAAAPLCNALFQWLFDAPVVFTRISAGIALRTLLLSAGAGALACGVAAWLAFPPRVDEVLRR